MLTKNDIPRLRSEAKRFRSYAKLAREESAQCKERCDWVGKLKADGRVTEYVRTAQDMDRAIKTLKAA
ncbi:hypothetical protein PEQA60_22010 [Pseudomonas sp. Eqa60]|uniref:hypothetical protein n=1 Tax=Pseudomonas sp. Eqa60 TaxID=2799184 RepID=UPI001BB38DDE|nr:hypothetical protein [Pseudomonas sp. Eqa60]BCQ68211.1 hypothetical protein PEQA60_22010 [Pseudomonas sp. Eqa60]